jgi:hypothetical protein
VQRRADGLDEIAEGVFEVVERANAAVGINQKVSQCLVVLTDAVANVSECGLGAVFGGSRARLSGRWRCKRRCSALTRKKIGDRTHGIPTT